MLVVFRRLLVLAVLAGLVSLAAPAPVAIAQTSSGLSETGTGTTPAPTAVEPKAGQPAPAQPGDTTPTDTTLTQTTSTTTSVQSGTSGGTVPAGSKTVTAGGTPGADGKDSGGTSWVTIAAIALVAVILFAVTVLVLWRWRGWDPRWLRRWRHATSEAGWRLSLGWAEFRDFVRLGR